MARFFQQHASAFITLVLGKAKHLTVLYPATLHLGACLLMQLPHISVLPADCLCCLII